MAENILFCASFVAFWSIIYFAFSIIKDIANYIRYKDPIQWSSYNPFYGARTRKDVLLAVGFIIVVVAGTANLILDQFFSVERMGAFYEKSSYTLDYDAMIELDEGTSFFCIATIEKDGGEYEVTKLCFPYGKVRYPEYTAFHAGEQIKFRLGNSFDDSWCELVLNEPATASSYTLLENLEFSRDSAFYASKNSDVYHIWQCRYLKKIKADNLIRIQNDRVAAVLGYEPCEACKEYR